jgi:bifunctional NMN adenylyltransferase/nudix hydrolase
LDYATRKGMVQSEYPDIIILPLVDQRYNDIWSNNLDSALAIPFGEKSLYMVVVIHLYHLIKVKIKLLS